MSDVCPVCNNPVTPEDAACPACGFKLLGSTQRFMPVDLTGEDLAAPAAKPAHGTLRIVRGPQVGTVLELGSSDLSVGRSPECDIFLNDMTVSREHARILSTPEGYRIQDDNSFNGVWVKNENVAEASLHPGDIVQIGAFCLLFED